MEICDGYGVPVICDSAEALGGKFLAQRRKDAEISTAEWLQKGSKAAQSNRRIVLGKTLCDLASWRDEQIWRHAGCGARAAVYSFNGNKIMTTSGGGILASDDEELIVHAKKLSQQAREDFSHYEHVEIGFNYRMSNVLAAIGRGQLRVLDERVKRKREIFDYHKAALGDLPGIDFMPEPEWSRANRWLTVVLFTPEAFGVDPSTISRSYGAGREQVRLALEAENIEARPVWKPMHLQPVFGFSRPVKQLRQRFHKAGKGAKAQRKAIGLFLKNLASLRLGASTTFHAPSGMSSPGPFGPFLFMVYAQAKDG